SPVGIFYGMQSFLQLLPAGEMAKTEIEIPAVEMEDSPRFDWRGLHLDVSRHFFPASFIKKYIDLLALHKMNVFHWHLTDDQGWRIEIAKYPRLTEVGAWRTDSDGTIYGGFYTQAEIRDVVAYAAKRFLTIVPEIELPGHASAAIAAYPEFSCTGGPFNVETKWGVFDDVYCPGRESTFAFLENILGEVSDLFPGPFIHIGGDECPKVRWLNHDLCRRRMEAEKLGSADELQAYFVKRIARYLASLGKQTAGWDEILDGGAPEGSVIMAWRNIEKGIEAARAGHDVIMTPMSHCYFDHYQAKVNEPKAIGGFTPLENVYAFNPVPEALPAELAGHILGAQANVWTEYMPDEKHVEYMAYPRACALAEVLWSPKSTLSYQDFVTRLKTHLGRLDALDVNYRRLSE
ncbi:MAG TPA: beta-N-acetylhexosaminidase, partial [Candidatus Acidoferrum sp.]|nr:beta-N-acetylhexosaminidase [Candidatus Acidoferrum sp.]